MGHVEHDYSPSISPTKRNMLVSENKRLPNVDSERIIRVIKMAITKITILSHLNDIDQAWDANKLESEYGIKDIEATLGMHEQAIIAFQNQPDEEAHQRLSKTTQSILRHFMKNGKGLEQLSQTDEENILVPLISSLEELLALLNQRLLTSVDEERARQEYFERLIKKEEEAKEAIFDLENAVADAEDVASDEIEEREVIIQKLIGELNDYEKIGKLAAKKVSKEAQRRVEKNKNSADSQLQALEIELFGIKNEAELNALQAEIDALKPKLADLEGEEYEAVVAQIKGIEAKMKGRRQTFLDLKDEHRNKEKIARSRKQKLELHIDRVIEEYDNAMLEKQSEIDDINKLYDEEKEKLEDIEDKLRIIQDEYDAVMEQRRIERERQEALELEMQKMVKAAMVLQKFWRSYQARKELKKKQGKKGKGGKKGSKKKKKK